MHRAKLDLSKDEKLFNGEKLDAIDSCIKNDWFYYIDPKGLCKRKVTTESSSITVLDKDGFNGENIQIINDWIFYNVQDESDTKLARINMNGEEKAFLEAPKK